MHSRRWMGGTAQVMMLACTAALVAILLLPWASTAQEEEQDPFQVFKTQTGTLLTIKGPACTASDNGVGGADVCTLDVNPFFSEAFGTNGQDCATCHQPQLGWSTTPQFLKDQFNSTHGLAPQFRLSDTATRPDAFPRANATDQVGIATESERRAVYDLSMDLGVARLAIKLSNLNDFTATPQNTAQFGPLPNPNDSQNPCTASDPQPCLGTLSLFRRPLVTTNMFFDSAVLWDGRQNLNPPVLRAQVKGATRTLLLGPNPSDSDADKVAHLMIGIFTAQLSDVKAGDLTALGALGGPTNLSLQKPCTPLVTGTCDASGKFKLFDAWNNVGGATDPCAAVPEGTDAERIASRLAVACGQKLFNTVDLHTPLFTPLTGSSVGHCVTCHAATNVGDNPSSAFFVNLGLADPPDFFVGGTGFAGTPMNLPKFKARTARLPLYTLISNSTGQTVTLTDPGRALISHHLIDPTTGFPDFGAFKPPILHDLAVRGPFFHNGAAETLDDVVDFYNQTFNVGLSQRQHNALVAFLNAL
jgi:cytochrome c peroxidase